MAKIDYFLPRLWSDEITKVYKASSILKPLMTNKPTLHGPWSDSEFVKDAALVKKWYNENGTPEDQQVMPLTAAQRKHYRASVGDRIYGMRITARDE